MELGVHMRRAPWTPSEGTRLLRLQQLLHRSLRRRHRLLPGGLPAMQVPAWAFPHLHALSLLQLKALNTISIQSQYNALVTVSSP